MKSTKDRWLIIFLCLNLVLLTLLVTHWMPLPQVQAQVRDRDYLLVPGTLIGIRQIVWVIDLRTHQLTSCLYNSQRRTIEFGPPVPLMAER